MKEPILITHDAETHAAYVYYTREKWASTIHLYGKGVVAVDLDVKGDVIGIEILGIDDRYCRHRERLCAFPRLRFPRRLASAAGGEGS